MKTNCMFLMMNSGEKKKLSDCLSVKGLLENRQPEMCVRIWLKCVMKVHQYKGCWSNRTEVFDYWFFLNWCFLQWTTDADVESAIQAIGVTDLVEVRFHENRANGQSKGFCVITVNSEASARACMDKLPKRELHGQSPIVTFTSKQALNQVKIICYSSMLICEYIY